MLVRKMTFVGGWAETFTAGGNDASTNSYIDGATT